MDNPFAELIELQTDSIESGSSMLRVCIGPRHLNPNGVAHGAVLYALADTGMGAALYPTLAPGELCATIEIKMNYFKPIWDGEIVCHTTVVNRGKSVANLDSRLYREDVLIARADGNYAIFRPRRAVG